MSVQQRDKCFNKSSVNKGNVCMCVAQRVAGPQHELDQPLLPAPSG